MDDDDVVEVVGKGGKRPAAGVGRTRVRKDTQVPKARASKRSRMEDVEQAEGEDDDDENVVEVVDVPAQGKGKKKATVGAARVKKEPDTTLKGKTAQRKIAEKSSGRGRVGRGDEDEDEDAEGEVDSSLEEPKSKRARVQISPPWDSSCK